jgi:peptidoglycan-N-acetylglucosamine deacetylase
MLVRRTLLDGRLGRFRTPARFAGAALLVALAIAAITLPVHAPVPEYIPTPGLVYYPNFGETEPGPWRPVAAEPPAGDRRIAYLTFDDGPSLITPDVLDILAHYDAVATFFVCGNGTTFGRNTYRRMLTDGHTIGNHSFSHDSARIYASREVFFEDFFRLQDLVRDATGFSPEVVRFPGGSTSGFASRELMLELTAQLHERGFQYFDWNVSANDSVVLYQEREVIVRSVLEGARNKKQAIILFHDSRTRISTVEALPEILEGLIAMGFEFQTLNRDSFTVQFVK